MRIFDGNVTVYSTCRDCGQLMLVIDHGDNVHPTCTPKPTRVETLAMGYLAALRFDDEQSAELTAEEIEKVDTQPPNLLGAAIHYARIGWPVFPLAPHDKPPAISKRAGGNGCSDATTDLVQIRKWWEVDPRRNIGLATGFAFDVIDIDPEKGGHLTFTNLLAAQRIPTVHGVVVSARGGLHLYIPAKGKGNKASVYPGIDYRGQGGYVVAPPSVLWHKRERAYSWAVAPSPNIKGGNG